MPSQEATSQEATEPLIELVNVSMSYPGPAGDGRVRVLTGVTMKLEPSSFLCVSGRSGSGKTTLLHIAAGLLSPTAGEVRWSGREIGSMSPTGLADARRSTLGFVFQVGGLIGSLTAAENVALPGVPRGLAPDARARALELLRLVGCEARAKHLPAQLSGGEQQRVALARSLFADPAALVVDEPTANLDRNSADGIIQLLDQLRSSGKALLVASHDHRIIDAAQTHLELD